MPASSRSSSSSLPALPTNGRPCSTSCLPGASPTMASRELREPSPKIESSPNRSADRSLSFPHSALFLAIPVTSLFPETSTLRLACRAIVGGPSGGFDLPDLAVAPRALLPLTPVREQEMVRNHLRVGSSLYRRLQHTPRLLEELFEGRIVEPFDSGPGVEVRLEEDLVRVDVPDTGHHLLVHQRRLHRALPPLETLPERGRVQLQEVGSQLLLSYEVLRIFDEVHPAEHPLVLEGEMVPIVEGDQEPVVRRVQIQVLEILEVSRHAEVHEQPAAAVQPYEEVLAVATGGLEGAPLQGALQLAGGDATEDLAAMHLDRLYLLVQRGRVYVPPEDLHVRKFRHLSPLPREIHTAIL